MNRGTPVCRRSNGALGRIAGARQDDGRYYVRFTSGSAASIHEDDLCTLDEPSSAGRAAQHLGEAIAGGPMERK